MNQGFEGNEKDFFLLAPGGASQGFKEGWFIAGLLTHCLCVRVKVKLGPKVTFRILGVRHSARTDPSQVMCWSRRDWWVLEVKRVLEDLAIETVRPKLLRLRSGERGCWRSQECWWKWLLQ